MSPAVIIQGAAAALLVLAISSARSDAAKVLLKDSWLKANKNHVTVRVSCRLEESLKSPHGISSSGNDGDIHMACRCPDIGLPMVAEIVNARQFRPVVDAAFQGAQDKKTETLTGVWRLWLEHPPKSGSQTQGATVPAPGSSNPDHVFEIHPLTQFGGEDLRAGFVPIPGYSAYPAKKAFDYYEKREFTVSRKSGFTAIEGGTAKLNYATFPLTLDAKPHKRPGGWIVLATIDGVLAIPRRMVIADGTPPATLISVAKKGDRFQALGIPRINLDKVDNELKNTSGPKTYNGGYEMIIMALAKKH